MPLLPVPPGGFSTHEPAPWSQSDPAWGRKELVIGDPTTRMSRIGCATVAVAEAGRRLGTSDWTPDKLLDEGRKVGAYVAGRQDRPERKTLIAWATAGHLVGVACATGDGWLRNSRDTNALRLALANALRVGVAIVHVDHHVQGADHWQGDHYLLALREDGPTVLCCDPAGGRWVRLSTDLLVGPSPHGPARPYKVRGVMPVRRLAGR